MPRNGTTIGSLNSWAIALWGSTFSPDAGFFSDTGLLTIARIREHRRSTRMPGDASRLVGWPSYLRAFKIAPGLSRRHRPNVRSLDNPQRRQRGANRVGHLARRQVRVMAFRHARVG